MVATFSSETSADFRRTTRFYIPDDMWRELKNAEEVDSGEKGRSW
jgi:hypothetical protein